MFTPRTPRSKKAGLALLLLVGVLNQGKAQEITLQPLAEYEASLKVFHAQKRDAARTEYVQVNKRKWWYYLPNLGLGLAYPISQSDRNGEATLTTRARLAPSINLGTSTLANIDQTKNQTKARLAAIDADAQFQYRVELHELRSRYEAIKIEKTVLIDQQITNRMENNIFAIAEDANRKKEIKPVEYQQAQLQFQNQTLAHEQKRREVILKIIDLEKFARYRFPDDAL